MKMKKILIIFTFLLTATMTMAQEQKKFSPEKFQAELEAYITKEAKFTAEEAAKFFPLLREMQQKQRDLYGRMRKLGKEKPATEEGCATAIRERDKLNVELRQLEQCYHKKMVQVVSPLKVYDAIKAETVFHRQMMKGWQQHHGQKGKRP